MSTPKPPKFLKHPSLSSSLHTSPTPTKPHPILHLEKPLEGSRSSAYLPLLSAEVSEGSGDSSPRMMAIQVQPKRGSEEEEEVRVALPRRFQYRSSTPTTTLSHSRNTTANTATSSILPQVSSASSPISPLSPTYPLQRITSLQSTDGGADDQNEREKERRYSHAFTDLTMGSMTVGSSAEDLGRDGVRDRDRDRDGERDRYGRVDEGEERGDGGGITTPPMDHLGLGTFTGKGIGMNVAVTSGSVRGSNTSFSAVGSVMGLGKNHRDGRGMGRKDEQMGTVNRVYDQVGEGFTPSGAYNSTPRNPIDGGVPMVREEGLGLSLISETTSIARSQNLEHKSQPTPKKLLSVSSPGQQENDPSLIHLSPERSKPTRVCFESLTEQNKRNVSQAGAGAGAGGETQGLGLTNAGGSSTAGREISLLGIGTGTGTGTGAKSKNSGTGNRRSGLPERSYSDAILSSSSSRSRRGFEPITNLEVHAGGVMAGGKKYSSSCMSYFQKFMRPQLEQEYQEENEYEPSRTYNVSREGIPVIEVMDQEEREKLEQEEKEADRDREGKIRSSRKAGLERAASWADGQGGLAGVGYGGGRKVKTSMSGPDASRFAVGDQGEIMGRPGLRRANTHGEPRARLRKQDENAQLLTSLSGSSLNTIATPSRPSPLVRALSSTSPSTRADLYHHPYRLAPARRPSLTVDIPESQSRPGFSRRSTLSLTVTDVDPQETATTFPFPSLQQTMEQRLAALPQHNSIASSPDMYLIPESIKQYPARMALMRRMTNTSVATLGGTSVSPSATTSAARQLSGTVTASPALGMLRPKMLRGVSEQLPTVNDREKEQDERSDLGGSSDGRGGYGRGRRNSMTSERSEKENKPIDEYMIDMDKWINTAPAKSQTLLNRLKAAPIPAQLSPKPRAKPKLAPDKADWEEAWNTKKVIYEDAGRMWMDGCVVRGTDGMECLQTNRWYLLRVQLLDNEYSTSLYISGQRRLCIDAEKSHQEEYHRMIDYPDAADMDNTIAKLDKGLLSVTVPNKRARTPEPAKPVKYWGGDRPER